MIDYVIWLSSKKSGMFFPYLNKENISLRVISVICFIYSTFLMVSGL